MPATLASGFPPSFAARLTSSLSAVAFTATFSFPRATFATLPDATETSIAGRGTAPGPATDNELSMPMWIVQMKR